MNNDQHRRPTVLAARTGYRMGRKDARRYAVRSVGEAHVDSQTVDRIASLIWNATRGSAIPSLYEDLGLHQQTKLRIAAQEVLSKVGEALLRCIDESPDDPVSFEAIACAAESDLQ